jgi:hypothetical protein
MVSIILVSSMCKHIDAYTIFASTEILLADCETKNTNDNANE